MALPRIALSDLAADAPVLCSTHRLARSLRLGYDRAQIARGAARWRPLPARTMTQWLDALLEEALLAGEIAAATSLPLSALQERILWERAIEAASAGTAEEALFDREGLTSAAAEANALLDTWQMRIPGADQSEETRQFLRWREAFGRLCHDAGRVPPARHLDSQLECIAAGAGRLPRQLAFAGFDRLNPQEMRLAELLAARGVAVAELDLGLGPDQPARAIAHALPDREAECRAAAAWARATLAANPEARLGLVVPELSALREQLAAILDDALNPEAASPAQAEMPRRYNFSLGRPLARQPVVDAALQLLTLAAHPRRVRQEQFGALLAQPYWSAGASEADGRARLDARMRDRLAPTLSLERALRFARKLAAGGAHGGMALPRLLADLTAFKAVVDGEPSRQLPSAWAVAFERMLAACAWPGERSLSSHEYQAKRAFSEALASLGELDSLLGRVGAAEAHRRLGQLARERIFQPETEGEPRLEVMGLLEAVGMPLDALWVMGMNDHLWPPPARPNPLLPAELQRSARAPNASAEVQGEFALSIHRRLLGSAHELRFSWALGEAHRELRASPLLAGIPVDSPEAYADPSLLQRLAATAALERLADSRAPAVAAGEVVPGGTGLLRAQAICPAWAYYRYRLGAKALVSPVEGLDAAERGTLVHAVLQHFWTGRGSQELSAMSADERRQAIRAAVASGLQEFNGQREEALTPRFLELERERLQHLVAAWLDVEAERSQPFRVIACEERAEVEIEGIGVALVVDRIDQLEDGRRVILDYKTGAAVSQASWGEERIAEPQLPVYAAMLASAEQSGAALAAVAFAKVRLEDPGFVGIAAEAALLPKVAGIAEGTARKLFPEQANWTELLAHWQQRIAAIAREIGAGEAAVRFASEQDLEYCEVLPLLRLAERRAQIEAE